jgi:hypothetical protein
LFSLDIHTEIFVAGFRDKIFDAEVVAALRRALRDGHSYVRHSAVKFFTSAMAQGALRWFYAIFIPKFLQRGFVTKYLILRWSPHFDVH